MILLVLCLVAMFAGIIVGAIFQKPVLGSILCLLAQVLIIAISVLADSPVILLVVELAICVPEIVSLINAVRRVMRIHQKKHQTTASSR